ncbi:unnamed protein product [Cylindrotheca closterium]|uniref:DNA replication complex GINS protein PSF3 n=1 Tax=Cylindrotheca closterium TaxID=2856 RepID=A0AAD2JM78_9STRA|nr:unnamed protein product [Cylindrotheca closterium]
MPTSYFDVDAILAEEELIPCTTLFEFSHLKHLDPDASIGGGRSSSSKKSRAKNYLEENSRIKLPLWALEKWANLGFVRLQLPRHYGRKARERLEADPGDADLRKKNERFFLAGKVLVDLILTSSEKVATAIASSPRWRQNARRTAHTRALEQVSEDATLLKRTLLKTFAGERLRQMFNWALSTGGDDDVSHFLAKLTEMEKRLFHTGATAVANKEHWSVFGSRRLVSANASVNKRRSLTANAQEEASRVASPDANENGPKRQRRQ